MPSGEISRSHQNLPREEPPVRLILDLPRRPNLAVQPDPAGLPETTCRRDLKSARVEEHGDRRAARATSCPPDTMYS